MSGIDWERLKPRFDPAFYRAMNPDVAEAGVDPWDHLRVGGGFEDQRLAVRPRAMDLDHMLWRGFEPEAMMELRALVAGDDPLERATSGWVLARWFASHGDWAEARDGLEAFDDHPEGRLAAPHAGPDLLGVQVNLRLGDVFAAEAALERAGARKAVRAADLALARVAILATRGAPDELLSAALVEVADGLSLAPGDGPRLDRLTAPAGEVADGPRVSVIVPVHDSADTLPTALRGLLAQDWPVEVIVVDDASTDGSAEVAEAHGVRVIRRTENRGAYAARNAGLAEATGELVTVHDADDWSHPSRIRAQAEALLETPEAMASVSHWARVDEGLGPALWRVEEGWVHRNVSSLMIRRDAIERLGYWDRVRANADTEYYHRLIAAYGPKAVTEVRPGAPLAFGRTSARSLTMQGKTHARTRFVGPRRDYLDAADAWHAKGGDLYLPRHPGTRPFVAPEALGPLDPPGAPTDFEALRDHPLMERRWYMETNPDVLMADVPAAGHYIAGGGAEGRDPGPAFSSSGYAHTAGIEDAPPLLHHMTGGDGDPLPDLDGDLAGDGPRTLLVAHAAGRQVFGAERSFLDMLSRAAKRGEVPVAVLPGVGDAGYLAAVRARAAAVHVRPQRWRHMARTPHPVSVELLRDLVRRHDARAVHVNTMVLDAPLAAARAEGVEGIVHLREYPPEDAGLCRLLGGPPEALRDRLLDEADRIVVNAPLLAEWLDAGDRVRVQLNRVDDALFGLPFAPGPMLRVGLVSSNIAKKGVADVVAVARRVGEVTDGVRFVLVGGESADLDALGPLPENVARAGYASGPVEAMAGLDVVLSLSKFAESFGRTVLEAMAAGRPVVCYDRGTPPWLVAGGDAPGGLVVTPDDTASVARAILALHAARRGLAQLSVAARTRAQALQAAADEAS